MHFLDPIPRPIDHLPQFGATGAPALNVRGEVLDYAGLELATGRLAQGLAGLGLRPGDRIATWLPKTLAACLLPMAAARAGLIHVPINPALRAPQVRHILADSAAELLVTAKARADLLKDERVTLLLEDDAVSLWSNGEGLPPSTLDPEELAAILYTSGSTGQPKGVMLSHANLWLGAISVAHYLDVAPSENVLAVLPLSFDYGQNQLFSSWAAGACVVPLDYLSARDVIKAVDRHDIRSIAGVPPLWVQLIEAEWPDDTARKIRRVTNSGGALTPRLIDALQDTFPEAEIFPMYGLTEAFRSTFLPPELVASHQTSMGRAIPFAEIMVVRPDGSVTDDGEPGELVHAGPLVAKGYWNDPERTAQRFRTAPPASKYGGLAVWSGDTVKRDAEGLLYFVGRDDEMIKVSGNRISPTEIEKAAEDSGAVAESIAIGVADERLGQSILLIARPKGEAAQERLSSWLRAELPAFMQPGQIIWRDELPRNANGKLDRAAIRSEFTS